MSVVEMIFSPTGGTEKVSALILKELTDNPTRIDLSNASVDFSRYTINSDDLVLIAMPSFGGRAPKIAIDRLKCIQGNGAQCILVCVYGNRAFEDTLVEMEDAAQECGFNVIAAIAAIAEHSIMPQYATGRPDAADTEQLVEFAQRIKEACESSAQEPSNTLTLTIPGNRPYKKPGKGVLVPKATSTCVQCGLCAKQCPVQAIKSETLAADPQKCIGCMRCSRKCPHNSRKVSETMTSAVALAIKKACSVRKENELFL